jgi:D-alanyl-D-alanine carboxypeptidase
MVKSGISLSVLAFGAAFSAVLGSTSALAQAPYIVVDASSGQVLLQEEATRPWNPASTTKMMTAYVALRAVQAGRAQLDSPLIASSRASAQKPSKIGIRPGQQITLENALKILMVKSANDLAVVIAEAIGGSVEGFSAMMNAEARRLGMNESRFSNPHGFHADGHQTSARDLAVLTRAMLVDFPEHRDLWGIGAVQMGNRLLYNTNGLIGRYSGATGMKTGFVCASGFNLVSTATRGGRTLIVVVLGAGSGGERVVRSAQLLDQGFGSWGGQGYSLQTLPRSGYASAPNMRSQICSGRRRGVILADDSDYGGAILGNAGQDSMAVSGNPHAFFAIQNAPQPTYGIPRSSVGRVALGPRSGISPIPVYYGPAPGSTAVALGPGGRRLAAPTEVARTAPAPAGIPASATALAPTANPALRGTVPGLEARDARPASQAAIRPAATPGAPRPAATSTGQRESDGEAAGAPMQLPGVITQGPRPGAQAAIRPRPAAAGASNPSRPQAQTNPQKRSAQANAPKAQQKAQPKNQPRKKKVEDDDE